MLIFKIRFGSNKSSFAYVLVKSNKAERQLCWVHSVAKFAVPCRGSEVDSADCVTCLEVLPLCFSSRGSTLTCSGLAETMIRLSCRLLLR